jgi:hypothetical protein
MATQPTQVPDSKGVALTWINAANGDKVAPGVLLILKNTSGSTQTVTIGTPKVLDGDLAVADRVSNTVAATTGFNALRIPADDTYRDPVDGLVTLVTFSVTGATFQYAVLA